MQNIMENSKTIIEKLTYNELISLKDIVDKRIIEYKREQILNDANESINEYNSNNLRALDYDELIKELNS